MLNEQPYKPKSYIAVQLRFVNALESFESGYCNSLKTQEEKDTLINKCKYTILKLYKENDMQTLIVFLDSKKFLDSLCDMPVKTFGADGIGHISFENTNITILKTLFDMYMIGRAKKIYRINAPEMFSSSCFALCSARMGDTPFINVDI